MVMKRLAYLTFVLGLIFFCTVARKDTLSETLFIPVSTVKTLPFSEKIIEEITAKPLTYLGNGCEAMAFSSHDNRYVLKLFFRREYHTKPKFDPIARFRQLTWKKMSERRNRHIANRYERALQEIPELTGMLDFHRYVSINQLPICTLIDSHGKSVVVDLNKLTFAIQAKGFVTDKEFLKAHREELDPKFTNFFTQMTEKGFVNIRRSFNPANFALLDGNIIMIDIGELKYDPEKAHTSEKAYLEKRYLSHFN
jgi:hypothetical protein